MRTFITFIFSALVAIILWSSFPCNNAYCKLRFKAKKLTQILDQYAKKGYVIVGPVEIDMREIKKTKRLEIINKEGKPTNLRRGDRVYIIKKGEKTIIIKLPFKKMENNE